MKIAYRLSNKVMLVCNIKREQHEALLTRWLNGEYVTFNSSRGRAPVVVIETLEEEAEHEH